MNFDVFAETRRHTHLPVFIGSGVTSQNINNFLDADGFIVGSHFKKGGRWESDLDEAAARSFMERVRQLKRNIASKWRFFFWKHYFYEAVGKFPIRFKVWKDVFTFVLKSYYQGRKSNFTIRTSVKKVYLLWWLADSENFRKVLR